VKHLLSFLLSLALLALPALAAAQADEDEPATDAEGDEAEGDEAEGDEAEGDEAEGDGAEGDGAEPTGDEAEGEAAEGDEAEGDEAEGEAAGGDEAGGDEAGGDEAEGEAAEGETAEETVEPPPEPEPEPETSATEMEAGAGISGDLGDPTIAEDLEAARDERERAEEEPVDDLDAPEEEAEQLPFRGSLLLWDNEVTTATFDRSALLDYNPTYVMAFSLRPRYYLTDDVSVRLRQDLSIEMTDTDTRSRNREPVLADTILDVVHGNLVEAYGATVAAGGRLTLPTSIASRAYQKYFTVGANASVKRPFEDVLEGLLLGLSTSYSYTVAGSNVRLAEDEDVPQTHANFVGSTEGLNAPSPGDQVPPQVAGPTSVDHAATLGLSAALSIIENLSVDTSFTWWWQNGRGLADASVPVDTASSGTMTVEDGSDTHLRLYTWFTASVGYQVTDWINASLNYSHLTGEFDPDASRRNPFWSPDSAVSLTAAISLDELYNTFSGRRTAEDDDVGTPDTNRLVDGDEESDDAARAAARSRRAVQ